MTPSGRAVLVQIGQAGHGGDDEPRWDIEPDLGHLAQVGALAAEELLVLAVAFFKGKHILGSAGSRFP